MCLCWRCKSLLRACSNASSCSRLADSRSDSTPEAVAAGAGVFFTGMTAHGSYANESQDRERLAFATHYVREETWIYRKDIQETVPM